MRVGIEIVIKRSYDFQNLTFFRPAPTAIFDLGQLNPTIAIIRKIQNNKR